MSVAEQPYHHGSLRQVLLARAESTLVPAGARTEDRRRLAVTS
ncbi:hypothetical protein L1080_012635 [Rhodococcus sp. MSC1_016]|nr:hypothetical protein [Rhodococcus sp. MSC1_016]